MLVVISVSFILCSQQGGGTMGLFELLIRQHTITHAPVCGTRKTNKHLCLLQLEAMYRKSLDATRNGRLVLSAHVCVCLCVFFVCFHFIVRKGFRASSLNVFIFDPYVQCTQACTRGKPAKEEHMPLQLARSLNCALILCI